MYDLGVRYALGKGVAHDRDKSREWYQKAADAGYTEAKQALEDLRQNDIATGNRDALRSQSANGCDGAQVMRIAKGKKEEIRIYASEYMGRQLMNIRVFYPTDDGAEKRPGRGIAFSINLINELIRILDVAARHLAAV